METEYIPIQQGQWLADALKAKNANYKNIPSNVILNKLLPGLGATHMEIESKRHSIIIEPNVPVILGKTSNKPKLLAVWEKCTELKIKNYLKDNTIIHKKLLTTPEGYLKIKKVALAENIDIYNNDYFLLFDECEKVTQDYDYRPNISIPLNDFFNKFRQKAFVSATPLIPSDPRFEDQKFRILKIDPQYDYKKDLILAVTNNFDSELENYLIAHEDSDCICIFLNKTDDINKIINTFKIANQSKAFCSEDSAKKLKRLGFQSSENLELPLAKYNFFTSRFYSAVDIKLPTRIKPDILILTNDHPFTRVDPNTESIQIYGRFRNGFKSLTHIACYDEEIKVLNDFDIEKEIETMKTIYDSVSSLREDYRFSFTHVPNNTIRRQLENLDYKKYLDENDQLNFFAVDNRYYENKVNSYYKSPDTLKKAYEDTNHFNANYNCTVDEEDKIQNILKSKQLSTKILGENIVKKLEQIESDLASRKTNLVDRNSTLKLLTQMDDFIVEVYYTLGKATIEKYKYSESKLKKELDKHKKELYRLSSDVAQEIYDNFQSREGTYVDKNVVQQEIKNIYIHLGIDYNVKKNTVEDYYDNPTVSNSRSKPSYKLEVQKRKI